MGPLLPGAVTLLVGVVLGAKGKDLLSAAARPVGRVARPALRATIRQSMLLSREVQQIAQSTREDLEDLTAEARQEVAEGTRTAADTTEQTGHTRAPG